MSRRPGPLLRASPAVAAWLIPALTLLALAGALLAILGAAAIRQGSHTETRLKGAATVVVWGRGLESSDAAQARATEILAGVADVQRATALDPSPDDQRVAQAMGAPAGTEARLVAVSSASTHLASQLTQVLRARGVSAVASDRAATASPGRRALLLALVGDVGLPLLVILAMIAVSAQAARRRRPSLGPRWNFSASSGPPTDSRKASGGDGVPAAPWPARRRAPPER